MLGGVEIIGKYSNPFEGKRAAEEHDIDIVFLDIHIPELNGIELAETLLETKPALNVVFVTTYGEYAIKAFELNALDYVLKPVRLERLELTTQRIKQRAAEPAKPVAASHRWNMQLFGEFKLIHGDQASMHLQFRTSKAQELFFYLLHNRMKVVGKDILMELLWPDFEPTRAASQLYTSVYHIRKTLAPYRDRIHLQNTIDGYVLKLQDIDLDVDAFEQLMQSDNKLTEDHANEYERILDSIKGDYLEQFQYDWLEYERQRYQLQWIRLQLELVTWYDEQQKFEKAFKLCDRLCSRFPSEEQAQLMLLQICDKLGYSFLVERQYNLYKSLLESEYHEQPGSEIAQWYHNWEQRHGKERI